MLAVLVVANLKMLVRNRQSLFWALAFPLIFVGIFALFDLGDAPTHEIAVVDFAQDEVSRRIVTGLESIDNVEVEIWSDSQAARQEVIDGDLDFLLILPRGLAGDVGANVPARIELLYDQGRPTAASGIGLIQRFLDQVNLALVDAPVALGLDVQGVRTLETDYFDFLLPGFVGMRVMTFSIIGLATVLALYREQKIFKRILATPLRVRTFFASLILAYLALSLVQAAVILGAGVFILDANVHGNLGYLAILVVLGNLVFLGIGFVVGAYAKTVSAAAGLGNAVVMPMMFLSGTFFPTDDLPRGISTVVTYLPLAPMLEAMRGVSLDAKPIWDFPLELAVLAAWIGGMSLVAMRVFRFR